MRQNEFISTIYFWFEALPEVSFVSWYINQIVTTIPLVKNIITFEND